MPTAPVIAAAKDLFAAVGEPGTGEAFGREGWLDVLSDVQAAKNVLAAIETVAMAQVAAFDSEDGYGLGDITHRGLGHRAMDAPDLVADRLGCSSLAAAGRVDAAIEQVTTTPTLVRAMAEGELDGYRAAIVTDELSDAPVEVRAAVVDRLAESGHLTSETAGPLRRRARKVLGALAPDVLDARVADAGERRGLHRSTQDLGVDHWEAWLPVESARPAWAAITELAQEHLRAGRAMTLAQARADALLELIEGRARGSYSFHVTVPVGALGEGANASTPAAAAGASADAMTATATPTATESVALDPAGGDDLVPVTGLGTPGETLVSRRWLRELSEPPAGRRRKGSTRTRRVETLALDDGTGAIAGQVETTGPDDAAVTSPEVDGYRPSALLQRLVRARDGGCRFPGCTIGVRFVDLDHVIAYDHDDPSRGGRTVLTNLVCLCRRHHRIKQRPGWSAVLHPDGTMTWTDPSGRTRTTWPQDHRPPDRPPTRPAPPEPTAFERPSDLPDDHHAVEPADLEAFSMLEDDLLVRLRDLTGAHLTSVHNDEPRDRRRCHHPPESDLRVETRHRPTLFGRRVELDPAWLAEIGAAREAASAPPF